MSLDKTKEFRELLKIYEQDLKFKIKKLLEVEKTRKFFNGTKIVKANFSNLFKFQKCIDSEFVGFTNSFDEITLNFLDFSKVSGDIELFKISFTGLFFSNFFKFLSQYKSEVEEFNNLEDHKLQDYISEIYNNEYENIKNSLS